MPIAQDRLEVMQVCKLLQCVREGLYDQIEKLTISGIPHLINYNDPTDGNTALGVAASMNNDAMLEFLLGLGAHPDVVDFKGRTATMRAAEFGHMECVDKLARAQANMRIVDLEGQGVLFYCIASSQRHERCFDIAVLHGAEVNNKTKEGGHVLLFACETSLDNEDMCLMLLQKGADPNCKHEKTGRTPLMAASESGSARVARALMERGADVNRVDGKRMHAAHYAAIGGHFDILCALSGFGADFNQTNIEMNTPIHLAAKSGFANGCKYLSQRGCNPKPKNKKGDVAKTIAKDLGHKAALKELKKAEKSFGKVSKNNEPWAILLYDWVSANETRLIELFKKYDEENNGSIFATDMSECLAGMKVPVDDENVKKVLAAYGKTGKVDYYDFITGKKYLNKNFMLAAFSGKKKKKGKKGRGKAAKFKLIMPICTQDLGPRAVDGGPPSAFIDRHIHFTDTGRFGRDIPPEHPVQDDSAWYIHHPERSYLNINEAAKLSDYDSLKSAIAKGITMDTRDRFFKTPLMVACAAGNLKMVKFLMDNGAQVNTKDNFKWTPLHHAAHSGQLDIVEYLLDREAEIDCIALNGGTPLYRAIESSKVDVVQYLINRGAKIQIENKKGLLPVSQPRGHTVHNRVSDRTIQLCGHGFIKWEVNVASNTEVAHVIVSSQEQTDGNNPFDIAVAWADMRVLDAVKTKWDSLPAPSDKKGKGKKTPAKRPKTSEESKPQASQQSAIKIEDDLPPALKRKGSILRAASALAGGLDETEDITYEPLKSWTEQATTEQLIGDKVDKRDRFGWEVDFTDFKMPFQKNAAERLTEVEAEE